MDYPQFSLYGEQLRAHSGEFVHVELIETRSRAHGWHIERHSHRGLFQVLFLFSGSVRASMNGTSNEHCGPLAIPIHPSVVHGFDFTEEAQGYVMTLDQQVLFTSADEDVFASLFVAPVVITLDDERTRMEVLLQQLLHELAWPQFGNTLMLVWLARATLLLLVRVLADHTQAGRSDHGDFSHFTHFRALVEQHYGTQWQIPRYASAMRLTVPRLNRLCLRMCGKSAFDVTQDRLMLEACRKLTYAPSSISSIAYELGFEDPAYFSRLFKKRMGLTPRQFRLQPLGAR